MSEYQSYFFQTVGRSLSAAQKKEVQRLSSHIAVSGSEAFVDYHYGSFKHDPIKVLSRFFDIFVYEANWGSQTVAFRFDQDAVDPELLRPYELPDAISVDRDGDSILLCVTLDNEEGFWVDGEGADNGFFATLYEDLMAGDLRTVFLLWLSGSDRDYESPDEGGASVPVPPGLSQLEESHLELVRFLRLNQDLLAGARALSERKTEKQARKRTAPENVLHLLTAEDQRSILLDLLNRHPYAARNRLSRLLRQLAGEASPAEPLSSLRQVTFGALLETADFLRRQREQSAREEAERRRQQYLEKLARHEPGLWRAVDRYIAVKTSKSYDTAVELLRGLQDLAQARGEVESAQFRQRVVAIVDAHPRLTGLKSRLQEAFLPAPDIHSLREQTRRERIQERFKAAKEIDFGLLAGI